MPRNLATSATAFTSSDLGAALAIPHHRAVNVNDGLYGNANSWIGSDDAASPFNAGVMLPGLFDVTSIAWGRDNGLDNANGECCSGQLTDRALGTYTIQRTLDGVSWDTVGILDYNYSVDDTLGGGFTPYFRHEFSLSDGDGGILARGLRVLVPTSGIGGGTAIDEIEIYGTPVPEPASAALMLGGLAVFAGSRRKRA